LPDADEIRRLREELRATDPAQRVAAMSRLGEVLSESARAIVAEALASDNAEVREAAEALLARLGEVAPD
jgi:HEAT repeat protein